MTKKSAVEKSLDLETLRHYPAAVKAGALDGRSVDESIALVETELDLIEEGQEAAEHYTKREIAQIREWLKLTKGRPCLGG